MKLNLGCQQPMNSIGWTSVDLMGSPNLHENVFTLSGIPDGTAEVIIASHVLEHAPAIGWGSDRIGQAVIILGTWYRKLQPGGLLYLSVPDGEVLARALLDHPGTYWMPDRMGEYIDLIGPIFGGGYNQYDHHYMLYTFQALHYCLGQVGFERVDHLMTVEDLLPDYNPNANKITSLNVRATKGV